MTFSKIVGGLLPYKEEFLKMVKHTVIIEVVQDDESAGDLEDLINELSNHASNAGWYIVGHEKVETESYSEE
jgi:hypothetical protein